MVVNNIIFYILLIGYTLFIKFYILITIIDILFIEFNPILIDIKCYRFKASTIILIKDKLIFVMKYIYLNTNWLKKVKKNLIKLQKLISKLF